MKRVIYGWMHSGNTQAPFFVNSNSGVDTLATTSKDVISNGNAIRVKITIETLPKNPQTNKTRNCGNCNDGVAKIIKIRGFKIPRYGATCNKCEFSTPSEVTRLGAIMQWNDAQRDVWKRKQKGGNQ
jgi:transcription elongation factor Elf1